MTATISPEKRTIQMAPRRHQEALSPVHLTLPRRSLVDAALHPKGGILLVATQ
jgi:hypothetical protein